MRLYAFGRAHHPAYRQNSMYTQFGTGRSMCNVRAARPFLSRRTTAFVCNVGERDGLSFLFYCFCLDLLLLPVFCYRLQVMQPEQQQHHGRRSFRCYGIQTRSPGRWRPPRPRRGSALQGSFGLFFFFFFSSIWWTLAISSVNQSTGRARRCGFGTVIGIYRVRPGRCCYFPGPGMMLTMLMLHFEKEWECVKG